MLHILKFITELFLSSFAINVCSSKRYGFSCMLYIEIFKQMYQCCGTQNNVFKPQFSGFCRGGWVKFKNYLGSLKLKIKTVSAKDFNSTLQSYLLSRGLLILYRFTIYSNVKQSYKSADEICSKQTCKIYFIIQKQCNAIVSYRKK